MFCGPVTVLGDVSEIKGCVEVKVTFLNLSLIVVLISVNIKQHVKKPKMADTFILPYTAVQPLVLWQCLAVALWQWVISKEAVGQAWGILNTTLGHRCHQNHPNWVVSSE